MTMSNLQPVYSCASCFLFTSFWLRRTKLFEVCPNVILNVILNVCIVCIEEAVCWHGRRTGFYRFISSIQAHALWNWTLLVSELMLDAQGTDSAVYAMIPFLTPSFHCERHHSFANSIVRLLTPPLIAVGR